MPSSRAPKTIPVTARVIEDYIPETAAQPTPQLMNQMIERWYLYLWYDRMPELRGIVTTMIADIFGEGYGFDGSDARVKKVKNFAIKNQFSAKMKAVLRDRFIGGDGYLGVASVSTEQALQLVETAYSGTLKKSADQMAKAEILSMAKQLNPDLFSPSVLYALPGISMRINYDAHGNILGYIQRPFGTGYKVVDSNTNVNDDSIIPSTHYGGAYPAVQYSPDEVVHFPHEPVGDSIYGTSPIQTALLDIAALWYAKNYGGTFFQNSAIPAYLYIMENESPESKNYKNFITELKKHKQNPHKNMVITGNVRVERVSPQNKDLEFSTFMDKYLQRIVMAWGATARFSHLFTDKLETPANLESYYKKINETQSEIEEKLNNELFSQFDVEFYFNRIYKRDESREADIVTKLVGLTLTVNEAREYLGYKPLPGEEFNTLSNTPKRSTISEAEAADRRTDQNMENPSAPGRPKDGVKEQTEK